MSAGLPPAAASDSDSEEAYHSAAEPEDTEERPNSRPNPECPDPECPTVEEVDEKDAEQEKQMGGDDQEGGVAKKERELSEEEIKVHGALEFAYDNVGLA